MLIKKFGEKELKIKFGYKATLKSRIITRMIKAETVKDDNMKKVEDLLLLIPEIILVGLQKFHKDEFGYNYDTNEGKENALDKVFDMMDEYLDADENSILELYNELNGEMLQESFLRSVFQTEKGKLEQKA